MGFLEKIFGNYSEKEIKKSAQTAGETKDIKLAIDNNAFTVVNDAGERVVEASTFQLYIGMSSEDKACMLLVDRDKNS